MDDERESLQYDRRLARRRGWITPEKMKAELDSLPDLGEKAEAIDSPFPPVPEDGTGSEPGSA